MCFDLVAFCGIRLMTSGTYLHLIVDCVQWQKRTHTSITSSTSLSRLVSKGNESGPCVLPINVSDETSSDSILEVTTVSFVSNEFSENTKRATRKCMSKDITSIFDVVLFTTPKNRSCRRNSVDGRIVFQDTGYRICNQYRDVKSNRHQYSICIAFENDGMLFQFSVHQL